MLKRHGYMLSDQQVREIKMNLVRGVTLSALSRMFGVSIETLSRIRRGVTYQHVKVLGEEQLRPPVEMVAPTQEAVAIMSGVTDEQLDAQAHALIELQERMKAQKVALAAVGEVEELSETERLAQSFLGNTPLVRR